MAGCGAKVGPGSPDDIGHSHKDRTMRLDRSRDNKRVGLRSNGGEARGHCGTAYRASVWNNFDLTTKHGVE
eukprot:12930213-Prorocentrum_lima.AAC.1